MVGRIVILIVVAGGAFFFLGLQEYRVSSGSTDEPELVSLADIERGNRPDNNHLRFGPHYRVLVSTVYECEVEEEDAQPTRSSPVSHAFYPIYSAQSPFGRQVEVLLEKYGPYSRWPEDVPPAAAPPYEDDPLAAFDDVNVEVEQSDNPYDRANPVPTQRQSAYQDT